MSELEKIMELFHSTGHDSNQYIAYQMLLQGGYVEDMDSLVRFLYNRGYKDKCIKVGGYTIIWGDRAVQWNVNWDISVRTYINKNQIKLEPASVRTLTHVLLCTIEKRLNQYLKHYLEDES